jgi:tryptophan synthase beta subunit
MDNGSRWNSDDIVLICLSGRGDKDMSQVAELGLLDG